MVENLVKLFAQRLEFKKAFDKMVSEGYDPESVSTGASENHASLTKVDNETGGFVHFNNCWNRYLELQGDNDKLMSDFKISQVEMWMSGLACCQNALCSAAYDCIIPPVGENTNLKKYYDANLKNCPPGCGCDNPWPFMGGGTA